MNLKDKIFIQDEIERYKDTPMVFVVIENGSVVGVKSNDVNMVVYIIDNDNNAIDFYEWPDTQI